MSDDIQLKKITIEEWVAALRSGKFPQGATYLRAKFENEILFCCLGVACEMIAGTEAWSLRASGTHCVKRRLVDTFEILGMSSTLPWLVQAALGLRDPQGMFSYVTGYDRDFSDRLKEKNPATWEKFMAWRENNPGHFLSLALLNDNLGFSFSEIADVIECRPRGLFGPPNNAKYDDGQESDKE